MEPNKYKIINIETINSLVQQCRRCELSSLEVNIRETNIKYGKLILNHKFENEGKTVLFVGLNPSVRRYDPKIRAFEGKEEGKEIKFMETSGGLFDRALREAGFDKFNVFITNLVKCSTQDNREPSYLEVQCCSIFIVDEIRIINPDIIVALGAKVDSRLTELNIKHIKTWHPSAVLRAKFRYGKYIEKLKEIADGINSGI